MLTNNFACLLNLVCSEQSSHQTMFKSVTGAEISLAYITMNNTLGRGQSLLIKSSEVTDTLGYYLTLGTGTTPPKSTDIALENLTENYTILTQTKSNPIIYSDTIFTITRVIENTSENDLTISEVGLYACVASRTEKQVIMLAREVIEPITLASGEKHSFTLNLCVQ